MYYNGADQLTDSVDFGTNGGQPFTRPSQPPARPTSPTASPTALVTSYHYDADGEQDAVIDPRGIVTATVFDDLGDTLATINNYTGSLDAIQQLAIHLR